MPRFVGLPVVVEAHCYDGHLHNMPDDFRLAVRAQRAAGTIDVLTGSVVSSCRQGDWIVRGPDGGFTVQRHAMFETWFAPFLPELATPTINPAPSPLPAPGAARRKSHG